MPNLVFISKGIPNGIKSAGDIRALNMLRILREKFDITVIATSADYGEVDVKGIGCEVVLSHNVKDVLDAKSPDVIIISHWSVAERYLFMIKPRYKVKIIVDTIDLEFLRLQRMHDYKGEENYSQVMVDRIKKKELEIYKQVDKIIVASDQDKEELLKYGDFKTIDFPCIYSINPQEKYISNNKAYIIGNWNHEPNIEATLYLCKKIIPHVDVKFYIIGKHTPEIIASHASNKIIIHGVEYELQKFLTQMSICLAPTLYGAGMNGKIGEALAFGIPVVTTPYGAIPYGLKHKETAMVADSEGSFIDSINQLLNKDFLRNSLRINGKKLMENYTIEFWKKRLLEEI